MSFDCPTGDGQPQAGAAPFTGACFVDPIESVEDVGLMFGRNSGPLINDIETRLLVLTQMYANENATLDGRIFDCIIQKIDDGLTKNQRSAETTRSPSPSTSIFCRFSSA